MKHKNNRFINMSEIEGRYGRAARTEINAKCLKKKGYSQESRDLIN